MQTYLFYDIETTGLNMAFDQILQFAAIRTDMNLRELERYEFNVKLNSDVIPSPKALMTHHIGVKAASSGLSEIEAVKEIHRLMNQAGTISLGYNTLGFDDEFLRFSFYRNLLTPYTHQYANNCGRMDLFPMAAMYFLFKNAALNWPEINGKISLKLENLNAANQLADGRAHDAMVDVEATVALAKRFFQDRDMWDYVTAYFNKQVDETRSQQTEALYIDSKLGSAQYFQAPVLFLGVHQSYKKWIWLKLDSEKLTQPGIENLEDYQLVANKKLGEPGFILPMHNRFLKYLSQERQARVDANKAWLHQHPDFLQHLMSYHTTYKYPYFPDTDVDARLYVDGFWSEEEATFCRRFHAAYPSEKALLTEHVKSPRLKMLATRLLGRHYREALTPALAEVFSEYMQSVNPKNAAEGLFDYRYKPRLTPQVALKEIEGLIGEAGESLGLLMDLQNYLEGQFG